MNTPIKLINPLSDQPIEMWLQAITDFEEILDDPRYKIDMGYWYETFLGKPCLVCMAGASMVRRSQGLHSYALLMHFDDRTASKFSSIDSMRMGRFVSAVSRLHLPEAEHDALLKAVRQAITRTDTDKIEAAGVSRDWPRLIKLLRDAIARIDAEYTSLHENTPHQA